ncbi:MAG TPA: deoxyribonuclease IV [Candidatus Polarisedimenticolaceae bacterium]
MNEPRFGAHMSIAGGMPVAVERAVAVGSGALQVFVKSSNQWAARPFAAGEIDAFRRAAAEAGIERHLLAHASYLINLASSDDALWERSTQAFGVELDRCAQLGIPSLVVHPGSPKEAGAEEGVRRVALALDRVYAQRGRREVRTLLEITAGQGKVLGGKFEELGAILAKAACEDRLGVCFDTCHAVAAGHDLSSVAAYDATFERLDRAVGLSRLGAFHLNDSKGKLGSRLDRHEHLGRGTVGLDAFRRIVNDRRFRDLPMVLETPKGDDLAEDRENLAVLRGLLAR